MPAELVGCLDDATLREFFAGWAEVVAVVERVKAASAGGALIQYPKIPPSVSESLAARILVRESAFPAPARIARGGGADLRVLDAAGAVRRVEVKGSGTSEFQTFGRKDYDCDLLVWLRFGDAARLGLDGTVNATLIPTPRLCLGDLGNRVTHRAAEAAVRPGYDVRRVAARLADLLGP